MDRSFEQLYRGHHADVFRAALRELGNVHDAEDVTQAAFVDAYRAVLRGSRPEAPRAWLLAIAENVRRRRYRTALRRPREVEIDADFPLANELSHELARALAEALAELPAEQRQVFVLRELGGLSYEEIADEAGTTVGAIQMQLHRARRTLRERLEPPTVGRRRTGFLAPLPGWVATIVSRAELALPTARAVGAVGATAVAVVGATVAVDEIGADPTPVVDPRPAVVARANVSAPPTLATAVFTPPSATAPARPVQPVSGPAPASAPASAPAPPQPEPTPAQSEAPPTAAAPRPRAVVVETATQLLEPLRLPVRVPVEEVERVLELPGPPDIPGVPPLSTAPVLEALTGAARAAGEGAPPLPVPGMPPVTVPPAP